MSELTPEVQQARTIATNHDYGAALTEDDIELLVDAVLALTEKQPRLELPDFEPSEEQLRQFESAAAESMKHGKVTILAEQPEPASLAEFHTAMWGAWKSHKGHFGDVVTTIYDEFTITRKPAAEPVWARAPKPDYRPEYVEDEIAAQFHRSQREHEARIQGRDAVEHPAEDEK